VPLPPPGRVAGNCVGQHRILLKGCNAKHGFYIFKYVYSFSTRRNQTQIKKEEADSQSTIPIRQLDKDSAQSGPTEDRAAPKHDDDISADATLQYGPSLKPENHSIVAIGGHGHSPRPGTSTRARGGVGITGPTPASSEGSGDLDLVIEVDSDVPVLPQGRRAGEAMVGNRSADRSEDRDDGAPKGVPVERPMTTGRERAPATGGAGDDSSGEATVHGQEQESVMRGTGMGGSTLASVTENIEDVQVDTTGVDEYAFIPDSGSVTVTHGELGNTSLTQISPDKDDEVNIFIGRASIRVGEQESTQPSATVGSEDDSIPTAGTSSTLPRLGFTSARGGDDDDDDGIPARRQPEGPATTATPIHGDSITSSHGDDHPTRGDEDGVTTTGDGEGLVARGNSDDEVRTKGASIHLGTTVTSPRVSEEDCTTAKGTASGHTEGESAMVGR
ncbi:PREDICTED: matrix extracellular phosphoglycoprotein, partial [Buceros rhinoceros silvestris]|uniref:matrix extracellular phosphoglycoprotein n=1 Tax=Buceros rhinoceros silvestris TaxID=175836 RepID=UPI0005283445